jgi:hypothetical protein
MKKIIYLFALFLCVQIVLAQQDSSYFPLAVGNKWIYRTWNEDYGYGDYYSTWFEVNGTEVINDTTYYVVNCRIFSGLLNRDYFRKDSLGNVYTRCGNKDELFLNPSLKLGEITLMTGCRGGLLALDYEFDRISNYYPWGTAKVKIIGYSDYYWSKTTYAFTPGYGCINGNYQNETPLILKRAINSGVIATPQVTGIISITYNSQYQKILLQTMAVMDTTHEILLESKKRGIFKGSLVRFKPDPNFDYSYGPAYSIVSNLATENDSIKITVPATVKDILGDGVDGNGNRIWEGSPIDDYIVTVFVPKITKINPLDEIKNYKLFQNYPNPFNPSTRISFSIYESGFVKLAVYDLLGREIKNLVSENRKPGNYEVNFDASSVAGGLTSGVYFYKLQVNNFIESKKMFLVK